MIKILQETNDHQEDSNMEHLPVKSNKNDRSTELRLTFDYGVLHQCIDSGVFILSDDVLKYGRSDRSQLQNKKLLSSAP